MGKKRPNAEQRRLSQLRALRDEHFPEADALEEQLAEKDRRIAELEREVELLQLKLSRPRSSPESSAPQQRHQHGVF